MQTPHNTTTATQPMPATTPTSHADRPRWPIGEALAAALPIVQRMEPTCERIAIVGSVRRELPTVGDVELLYIPRPLWKTDDSFSLHATDTTDDVIRRMLDDGTLTKRKSIRGTTAFGDLNKLCVHKSGIPFDLFATTEESWFNYLVCRTGPAAQNKAIATLAKRKGYRWNPYGEGFTNLTTGLVISMYAEHEVFQFVGLRYTFPRQR